MKVYPDKLEATLKQSLSSIYIISGDEPLLVQETGDLLRAHLKRAGYTERELMHAEGKFDWQQVLYSANSMSLFAEQKIIEIRMASAKPGDAGAKVLNEFAANPPDGTIMLLVMPRLDQSVQRTKWFKTIEKAGVLIQLWPIEPKDLPRWIEQRFRKAGLKASREAVQLMSARIEGNLLAAAQEIERLKLLAPDGNVNVELIVDGVADSARYDVFTLIDSALSGNAARSIRVVRGLQSEGVDMLYITAMLARELRTLAGMALEMRQSSLDNALSKYRVWQKRKNMTSRCLRENSLAKFEMLQTRVARIDNMVKGIEPGAPWDELTSIVGSLAGVEILNRSALRP